MKRCLSCDATFTGSSWSCPECAWSPSENGVTTFAPALLGSSEHFPRDDVRRLSDLEEAHFWFAARNELILWAISSYFPRARTLLEVGCGTGIVLSRIQTGLPRLTLTGADLLPEALDIARERVPGATFFQIDIRQLPYVEEFDIVCALDVLEHIDEDAAALEQVAHALRPGGGVVISVPQHMWLWSAANEYGRHRRRYSKRTLLRQLDEAGFDTMRATSSVSFLLPIVAISRFRHRRLSDTYDPFREFGLPQGLNRLLKGVMSAERRLIRSGVSLPVGSSLTVVARKR